jgi:purine-binding chemotaxis protein CheW
VSERRVQIAVFQVGEQAYGLDIMRIKEIINLVPITPVPRAPTTMEGVVSLRGQVLPVVDLRKLFDRPTEPVRSSHKIIIARFPDGIVGLVVDGVREVVRIQADEIRPAPTLPGREAAPFFQGVCRVEDELVMILDLERVFSSEERVSIMATEEAR